VLKPERTMRALEDGLWIYRQYFLRRWRRSLNAKSEAFPELYRFGDLRRFRTLTETTDHFVRNYTEYSDLQSYLDGYSIVGAALANLDVGASIFATLDDPVIPAHDLDALAQTPALQITRLNYGGHCGLLSGYRLHSWIDTEIVARLVANLA
jgi:predicted alpha/beta-fold hydrolase